MQYISVIVIPLDPVGSYDIVAIHEQKVAPIVQYWAGPPLLFHSHNKEDEETASGEEARPGHVGIREGAHPGQVGIRELWNFEEGGAQVYSGGHKSLQGEAF